MTREEAINHLEDLQVFRHEPTETDREALGMAIEALRNMEDTSENLEDFMEEMKQFWMRGEQE